MNHWVIWRHVMNFSTCDCHQFRRTDWVVPTELVWVRCNTLSKGEHWEQFHTYNQAIKTLRINEGQTLRRQQVDILESWHGHGKHCSLPLSNFFGETGSLCLTCNYFTTFSHNECKSDQTERIIRKVLEKNKNSVRNCEWWLPTQHSPRVERVHQWRVCTGTYSLKVRTVSTLF